MSAEVNDHQAVVHLGVAHATAARTPGLREALDGTREQDDAAG